MGFVVHLIVCMFFVSATVGVVINNFVSFVIVQIMSHYPVSKTRLCLTDSASSPRAGVHCFNVTWRICAEFMTLEFVNAQLLST